MTNSSTNNVLEKSGLSLSQCQGEERQVQEQSPTMVSKKDPTLSNLLYAGYMHLKRKFADEQEHQRQRYSRRVGVDEMMVNAVNRSSISGSGSTAQLRSATRYPSHPFSRAAAASGSGMALPSPTSLSCHNRAALDISDILQDVDVLLAEER